MLVLLDRDGVLNEEPTGYVKSPDELQMILGAAAAVARLNRSGYLVAVVSNQSVVGRGIIGIDMLERIHERLLHELAREGGRLDALIHCTDAPWAATERRKPGTAMLREAMTRFRSGPAETLMIGDSLGDLQAAAALDVRRILVRTGHGATTQAHGLPADVLPVSVYDDLAAAVDALTGKEGGRSSGGGDADDDASVSGPA